MRDYVPISHTFPAQKPLMDENGKRKAVRPIEDLRVQTLKSQQHNQQQQQQQPPAKRPCGEGPLGTSRAAAASGDSQIGGVFHQRSMDSAEVQPSGGSGQATDFSAFNALVRNERQQQQQPGAGGGGSQPPAAGGGGSFSERPPQAPKTQFQVTTFDSLTSNALPADVNDHTAQLEGIRSLYGLGGDASRDGTGSLPGWPLPRAGSLSAANTAGPTAAAAGAGAATQQQQQQPFELEGLPSAPWDWSLKTRVRVSAPRPLACLRASSSAGLLPACRVAARGSAAAAAAAAAAPVPAPAGVGALLAAQDAADAALSERLQAALLQWQHPERQLGADALEVMRASKSTAELLAARAGAWRDALRALVAAVRNGQVPAAYVAGAQLFHQPLTVLFLAPGAIACPDSGSPAPAAIVSRSNRQLRQALDAVGSTYSMAAGSSGAGPAAGDASKQQQQQQQQGGGGAAPSAADGRAGSQLLVCGARGVQALYLLLLQQPFCTGENAGDVPVLLAPAPFAGAALCPCTFTELPGAAAAAAGPRRPGAAPPPATGARHYAEVGPPAGSGAAYYSSSSSGGGGSSGSGGNGLLVAPWTVARVAAVLAGSEREFEVFIDSEATSSSLNLAPALGAPWLVNGTSITPASSGSGVEGDVGLTVAERAAWVGSSRRLAGRTVRQLRFASGTFAARLAAP